MRWQKAEYCRTEQMTYARDACLPVLIVLSIVMGETAAESTDEGRRQRLNLKRYIMYIGEVSQRTDRTGFIVTLEPSTLRHIGWWGDNSLVCEICVEADNPPSGGLSADKTDSKVWREVKF